MLFSLLTIKVHIMAKNKVSDWSESSPRLTYLFSAKIQKLNEDGES